MVFSKGFLNTAAVARESVYGTPVLLGAGHGFEYLSDSIGLKADLIPDDSITGNVARLNSDKGSEFHAGDVQADFAYDGLEVLTALAMGTAGVPVQQGTDLAYKHALMIAPDVEGLFGTMGILNSGINVREYTGLKVNSVEFSIKNGDRLKVTYNVSAKQRQNNVANLATPGIPVVTPKGVTGAAAYSYRIVARSLSGVTLPGVAGTTATGNAVLSSANFNQVVWTAVAGADSYDVYGRIAAGELFIANVRGLSYNDMGAITPAGALPGANTTCINSLSGFASVTFAAVRNFALWSQLKCSINAQGGAAFLPADLQNISEISWKIENHLATDDVTAQFGLYVDEPIRDGLIDITGSIKFTKYNTNNVFLEDAARTKAAQKMLIAFTGPLINGGSYFQMNNYFPSIQFVDGSGMTGGPQRVPLELNFVGHRVGSIPTGFPAGYIGPYILELMNSRSTNPLA